MAVPYQSLIIGGIWTVLLVDAARRGLTVPDTGAPNEPRFLWGPVLVGLIAPPLLFAAIYFFGLSRPSSPGFVARWIDHRFGPGSAYAFLQNLRPILLMGCGCLVLGSVGLLSAVIQASSYLPAFGGALFFLFAGAWFVLASIFLRRHLPHMPF